MWPCLACQNRHRWEPDPPRIIAEVAISEPKVESDFSMQSPIELTSFTLSLTIIGKPRQKSVV